MPVNSVSAAILIVMSMSAGALGQDRPAWDQGDNRQTQRTVERAIGYLQSESGAWMRQHKCAACHHAAMPMWALNEAGRQGYSVDRSFLAGLAQEALGGPKQMIASGIANDPARPDPRPMAKGVNMGAIFMAVAAQSLPVIDAAERQSLNVIASDAATKQRPDGSWDFFLSRPPINESQKTDAIWILMALQEGSDPVTQFSRRARMEKGIAWLDHTGPGECEQEKVLKLLMDLRANAPRDRVQGAIRHLLARQKVNGGWSQTADSPSDAFATGQALYVLSLARYTSQSAQIRDGIEFLLRTQLPDGSWPMASRATPDGKPGHARVLTPITCAATAWATLGLARLAPEK